MRLGSGGPRQPHAGLNLPSFAIFQAPFCARKWWKIFAICQHPKPFQVASRLRKRRHLLPKSGAPTVISLQTSYKTVATFLQNLLPHLTGGCHHQRLICRRFPASGAALKAGFSGGWGSRGDGGQAMPKEAGRVKYSSVI